APALAGDSSAAVHVAFEVTDASASVFAHEYTLSGGSTPAPFDVEDAATLHLDYTGMILEITQHTTGGVQRQTITHNTAHEIDVAGWTGWQPSTGDAFRIITPMT